MGLFKICLNIYVIYRICEQKWDTDTENDQNGACFQHVLNNNFEAKLNSWDNARAFYSDYVS